MGQYLTREVENRLVAILERHKAYIRPPTPNNWRNLTDGQLWVTVLAQIAVVGSASSGTALIQSTVDPEGWYIALSRLTPQSQIRNLHKALRTAGVRYVAKTIEKSKKTQAAAENFSFLCSVGGPKQYFSEVAKVPNERWRIAVVANDLAYIKNKGARDLLIGLGQVQNAIALDTRIQSVLKYCGMSLPKDLATNKAKYMRLEAELLESVCPRVGITGAHLDRILFERYSEIIAQPAGG